jgi:hypothetical protein
LIAGEVGRMYEANVDDVGYRLVAIYTPVREDGVEGQPVSASTDPIAVGNLESHLMLILKFNGFANNFCYSLSFFFFLESTLLVQA